MDKHSKIIIDETRNAPADIIRKINTENYYDFIHHTHKISDLIMDVDIGSGDDGAIVINGKSAYEIWLSLGNTGTEQDFINSLKGSDAVSPTVTLSHNEDGSVTILVIDVNGTNSVTINGGGGLESGILIYDDFSTLPNTIDKNSIVYVKNEYIDGTNVYLKGFYFADASNSKYNYITTKIDWDKISNKLFEGLDSNYFTTDANSNLTLSDTAFDLVNIKIDDIEKEVNTKAVIDDSSSSTDSTWSASKIMDELGNKAESTTGHTHNNLSDVLNKFTIDESNVLKFDAKTIMTLDKYDNDSDGKIDNAKTAETLNGLSTTITELNYLQGLRSNIQSQIDSIISGVDFKGEHASFAAMQSAITNPQKGYWVYILLDETKDNQTNTQYVYDGSNWIYGGGRISINDASSTVKGTIQLSGDLTGSASAPKLIEITTAKTAGYIKSITVDKNGRVVSITEDDTLAQRIADLESRPQIYISKTQPANLKDGDFWIEE